MKHTIKEIAEMAGVHRSTVDKVLHQRVGVSDEVRSRVQQLIDDVGYTPNPTGQALQKQGKTYRIAVLLVDVDARPYLQEGIDAEFKQQTGFDISIQYYVTAFQEIETQTQLLHQFIEEGVDGILLSPINADAIRQAIEDAARAQIPVVTINSDLEHSSRLCYVGLDGERSAHIAARIMGQFMGAQGSVAIITNAISSENNDYYVKIREQEFSRYLAEIYPEIQIVDRIESLENKIVTYQKTQELLQRFPQLQGIYITCGGAAEVGRALRESGRQNEIRVLSFEDYPEILQLIREDVIDCTLGSELAKQGRNSLRILLDYLIFGIQPEQEKLFTETKILIKESLF